MSYKSLPYIDYRRDFYGKKSFKNAKPMLMIKKRFLFAYAATGILLLILAFLLYKMGLGESQINIGIMVFTYIVSCLFGGFYMGKKIKSQTVCMGYGSRYGYAVLLMAVTFLTVHQISGDFKEMLMMFFLCFFGGTLGGILA